MATATFGEHCALLYTLDMFAGDSELWQLDGRGLSHLSRPPSPTPDVALKPCRLELAHATLLHLRLLAKSRTAVTTALAAYGLVWFGNDTHLCLARAESATTTLTRAELYAVMRRVEEAMDMSPDAIAEKFEAATQRALRMCCDVVKESGVLPVSLDLARLDVFHMAPVMPWDAEVYGGSITDVMGITGLQANAGFCTMAHENTVTMPNFRQWTAGSELVGFKQKHCDPALPKPLGRLWRHMFGHCLRAACHEVVHLLQNLAGQACSGQIAEHGGYLASAIFAVLVMTRRDDANLFYPGE
jgi:hypothetical protein